ncbi:hypothetical protein MESS2_1020012 [Mesorhizobium metallidurans STM 2683]|uniref:Uncharacterized protein n=1 Tax=Mesorhizobium metallidurans STM 2683 TaxID=1297569 RepID=M5ETS3_9HYPH|nr:hypothetical protein MESS2_1020012 [Mesorhizobium metallidurans STM 2683]
MVILSWLGVLTILYAVTIVPLPSTNELARAPVPKDRHLQRFGILLALGNGILLFRPFWRGRIVGWPTSKRRL